MLTVAVIETPAFDELFGPMVDVNEEGTAVSTEAGNPLAGVPFCVDTLARLAAEPLSPDGPRADRPRVAAPPAAADGLRDAGPGHRRLRIPNCSTNPYGASKLAADHMAAGLAATGAIEAISLRALNLAGSGAGTAARDTTRLIPKIVVTLRGQAPELHINGDGSAVRDYLHVEDMADAVCLDSSRIRADLGWHAPRSDLATIVEDA